MSAQSAPRLEEKPFNLMPDEERMSEQIKPFAERRKKIDPMDEQDFRQRIFDHFDMVSARLEEGHQQFGKMSQLIDGLQQEISDNNKIANDRLDGIKKEIADNTLLTKEAGDTAKEAKDIAKQTAEDTAGLVGMYKSANSAKNIIATWSERISKASKLMTPILVLAALVTMLAHGKVPSWSDMLKLLG